MTSAAAAMAAKSAGATSPVRKDGAKPRAMSTYTEPSREIPVAEDCDVLVAGAGPAGVAAAIASARAGADTRLIETHGCLGGIWTAGLLSWIIDAANKPGIMSEITGCLESRGSRETRGSSNYAYDVETMKLLLEEMCLEAGVKVQLHTRVVAAGRGRGKRLAAAVTESKSGRQAWQAKVFVDTTGDGDLAAQAGCGFDLGHGRTGEMQPMSLIVLVVGLRFDEIEPFVGGGISEPKKRLLAEMERAGVSPSYGGPTLFRVRDDLFALMANHEYGVSPADAAQMTEATLRARGEVHELVGGLRSLGDPWSEMRIVCTPEQIGVREGRRIHGVYTVTADDLVSGARHADAICRTAFGMDVHSVDPTKSKAVYSEERKPVKAYDIPMRALIARDADNLLMAGRCISGDFLAHSSYRVTGNAVAMGQAAGTLAAVAAAADTPPGKVTWAEVQPGLDKLNEAYPPFGKGPS